MRSTSDASSSSSPPGGAAVPPGGGAPATTHQAPPNPPPPSTARRAYAYSTNRQASSSFGDFHTAHHQSGGESGPPSSSSGGAGPLSGGGARPLLSTDDADAAAGTLHPPPASNFNRTRTVVPRIPKRSHNAPHNAHNVNVNVVPSNNPLNAFRDSEADFLHLSSAQSLAGGGGGYASSSGYLSSGADSLTATPTPSPPTSGNGGGIPSNLRFGGGGYYEVSTGGEAGVDATTATGTATAMGGAQQPKKTDANDGYETMTVLGMDISHLSRKYQFLYCAGGVFFFSLLYGFLQELISVTLCCRQLGLFLAAAQFAGYTFWSYLLREYVNRKEARTERRAAAAAAAAGRKGGGGGDSRSDDRGRHDIGTTKRGPQSKGSIPVPLTLYLGLSLLRAIDLGATNLAMQYVNYPAKTLMKSSRVVFTMMFGVLVSRRRYQLADYGVVLLMVTGLAVFMHADASSSAVFQPLGIVMLVTSLMCDGAISNMSESLMNRFGVGQDEFIFRLYSIATVAIVAAAVVKGDMTEGTRFLLMPGTLDEINAGSAEPTWTVGGKVSVVVLFSTMGFFGSSCSAAITKHFGALTMSITSTARKATTLFLSFMIFNNVCTYEHVSGIVLFIAALIMKSLRASRRGHGSAGGGGGGGGRKSGGRRRTKRSPIPVASSSLEMTRPLTGAGAAASVEVGSGTADPALHHRRGTSSSPKSYNSIV